MIGSQICTCTGEYIWCIVDIETAIRLQENSSLELARENLLLVNREPATQVYSETQIVGWLPAIRGSGSTFKRKITFWRAI